MTSAPMTDPDYIPLERRLVDVAEEPSSGWLRRTPGLAIGKTWEVLVPASSLPPQERSAVVLLAPSGAGKTVELMARAERLQNAGVAAFYMRAADLATRGVASALAQPSLFQTWRDSATRGVFLIDAVDEARLEGIDLERVLVRFAQDVDPATKSVQLVLASRNDIWAASDARQVVRVLALPTEDPPVRLVRLEPLSLDDVRLYATTRRVLDVDAFVGAFADEELDLLFEMRPPDVNILVDYWQQHAAFGSWSEMLEASIEASVRNENRRHSLQQQFTSEGARSALARLGAATVLGKRPLISLPGSAHSGEVNAERLFRDQRPLLTSQLLAMGLFAQKGLHSVQLPLGAPSHFLAASWLGERARRGWDPRALEDVLFLTPFGASRTLTPPSRSPVVAWAAGIVPSLRKRLLRDQPHALLFEGDPSRLSRGECIEALRSVVANIRSRRHEGSPTKGTLRQIAKHDIGDAVLRLLGESTGTPRAEELLLRLAEVGRYAAAARHALSLALSPGIDTGVGVVAVRVASMGTGQERQQLLSLAAHADEWMRLALVQALAPATMNGTALVQLVMSVKDHDVAYLLAHALGKVELADIDAILTGLLPVLESSTIDDRTQAGLTIASRLALSRLTRSNGRVPGWMADLLLAVESHIAGTLFVSNDVVESLEASLAADHDLRRTLWERRIAATGSPDVFNRVLDVRLGAGHADDLEWFWSLRESVTDEQTHDALRSLLVRVVLGMSHDERVKRMESAGLNPRLKELIEATDATNERTEAVRRKHELEQEAEKEALRVSNIDELRPKMAEIETGQNGAALVWAWQHLSGTDSRRNRIGTGPLVELVGPELAEVFITGWQRWWRRHEPALRQPGDNSVALVDLAGLTGLSLEVERGLALANLSETEVERAIRYALYELNGFPSWFEQLRAAHPHRVRAVLEQVVKSEWLATIEHHGIISRAPYEPQGTAELVREIVVNELERAAPAHTRTVHYAIGALLIPTKLVRDAAPTLQKRVFDAIGGDVQTLAEWLRGWSHFAPKATASWLRALASSDQARFLDVVARVAALLEEDFDEPGRPVTMTAWNPQVLRPGFGCCMWPFAPRTTSNVPAPVSTALVNVTWHRSFAVAAFRNSRAIRHWRRSRRSNESDGRRR